MSRPFEETKKYYLSKNDYQLASVLVLRISNGCNHAKDSNYNRLINRDVCKLPLGPYSQRVVALAAIGVQTASPNLRLVIGGDPYVVIGKCCPNLGVIIFG